MWNILNYFSSEPTKEVTLMYYSNDSLPEIFNLTVAVTDLTTKLDVIILTALKDKHVNHFILKHVVIEERDYHDIKLNSIGEILNYNLEYMANITVLAY